MQVEILNILNKINKDLSTLKVDGVNIKNTEIAKLEFFSIKSNSFGHAIGLNILYESSLKRKIIEINLENGLLQIGFKVSLDIVFSRNYDNTIQLKVLYTNQQ